MFNRLVTDNKTNKHIYFDIFHEIMLYGNGKFDIRNNEKLVSKRLCIGGKYNLDSLDYAINLGIDTELAVIDYYENGLTKKKSVGEYNIRLYGTLNAISLQFESMKELDSIFNTGVGIKKIKNNSDIYKFRNIIGSHTLSYEDRDENSVKSFAVRSPFSHLDTWGEKIFLRSNTPEVKIINILKAIDEYNAMSEDLLKKLLNTVIEKLNLNNIKSFKDINYFLGSINNPYNYRLFMNLSTWNDLICYFQILRITNGHCMQKNEAYLLL